MKSDTTRAKKRKGQATLLGEWKPFFRVKKKILPKVKIINHKEGEITILTTKNTTPGIYELNFSDPKGTLLLKTPLRIKIEP